MHHAPRHITNPELAAFMPVTDPVVPLPSCDAGENCPLVTPCPECGPKEELVDGLRVVTEVPEPCADCILHGLLHLEAMTLAANVMAREMRKLRAKEALREVESRLGVRPVECPHPGHWYDEDHVC